MKTLPGVSKSPLSFEALDLGDMPALRGLRPRTHFARRCLVLNMGFPPRREPFGLRFEPLEVFLIITVCFLPILV